VRADENKLAEEVTSLVFGPADPATTPIC